ncbi:MAG TPA: acetylglutamate kinase [Deltaproteobacteria bacterium]|nr:acetylglutamate kinase [Deltaproteobacteria bacterium]
MVQRHIDKIKTLFEALPYIRKFHNKTIVIKYGGSAMVEPELKRSFARDVVLMKYVGLDPVIVHGGGPQIGDLLSRLGKESRFVSGIRVTDDETMDVVEMVLVGKVNKEIVGLINHYGGNAVGLGGKDGGLVKARALKIQGEEMGLAGDVEAIDPSVIECLDTSNFIPVIAPVGGGEDGRSYNINADLVAGRIATALRAEKLILLTDVEGLLDKSGKLVSRLTLDEARSAIDMEVATGGMIPKLRCCIETVAGGVNSAHIIDGRIEHAVLLEVFTDAGIGTKISVEGDDDKGEDTVG